MLVTSKSSWSTGRQAGFPTLNVGNFQCQAGLLKFYVVDPACLPTFHIHMYTILHANQHFGGIFANIFARGCKNDLHLNIHTFKNANFFCLWKERLTEPVLKFFGPKNGNGTGLICLTR